MVFFPTFPAVIKLFQRWPLGTLSVGHSFSVAYGICCNAFYLLVNFCFVSVLRTSLLSAPGSSSIFLQRVLEVLLKNVIWKYHLGTTLFVTTGVWFHLGHLTWQCKDICVGTNQYININILINISICNHLYLHEVKYEYIPMSPTHLVPHRSFASHPLAYL